MNIEDFLAHAGVKGMKWGVRKKEETSSRKPAAKKPTSNEAAGGSTNPYLAVKARVFSERQAKARMAENQKKFLAKADPSVSPTEAGGLTKEQKKTIAKVVVGVAIVGALVISSKQAQKRHELLSQEFHALSGKPIDAATFAKGVNLSKSQTWGFGGYIQPSSHAREAFELPAGHTFHRIATVKEKTFGESTYSTHSIEDFNRYVAGFRQEKIGAKLHHITFTSTEPIKVPKLKDTLDTLSEVMHQKSPGQKFSPEDVMRQYESMSGGSWKDAGALSFFEALRGKGYGAIVDEMDAGVIGETPLVLFSKAVSPPKHGKSLTATAIKKAESSLIELTNRKGLAAVGGVVSHSVDFGSMTLDDALAHYGVKGMKWGVNRRQARITRLQKVASGTANRRERRNVTITEISPRSIRTHGVRGAAANKAANMIARDERAKKGEATLKDLLARHGGDRFVDTGRVDKGRLMTPKDKRLTAQPGSSKVTKRVISDHNNLSDHDFARKYSTSKKTYAKRVKKYGDPYMNSPLAKIGKKIN